MIQVFFPSLCIIANLLLSGLAIWSDFPRVDTGDPHKVDLKILNDDGSQVIGSSQFTVWTRREGETIIGATTYLDGERDNEEDRLRFVNGALRLQKYQHSFFGAAGVTTMVDTLDAESRFATCSRLKGGAMRVRSSKFDLPADTFVGGSQLLIVMNKLRQGARKIDFHAFACAPGPRIFHVVGSVCNCPEQWPYYPGNLIRLALRPDLEAGLNLVFAPIMPRTEAWFDPRDNWNYVGGEFNRYFAGPHVLQVLVVSH